MGQWQRIKIRTKTKEAGQRGPCFYKGAKAKKNLLFSINPAPCLMQPSTAGVS